MVVYEFGEWVFLFGFIDVYGYLIFIVQMFDMVNIVLLLVGLVEMMVDFVVMLIVFIEECGIEEGEWVVGFGYDDLLIVE